METDNPAKRLLDLLERAQHIPKDRQCREAWKELLGASDPATLLAKLGGVMALPQAILQVVEEHHPGMGKHHNHWVSQLSAAFGTLNLDGPWGTFKNHLNSQTISNVALAASSLAGRGDSKLLTEDELSSLRDQVEQLNSAILEANFPVEMRKYLLRQVRRLKESIEDYWLSGGEPILDVVDATIGHLAMRSEYREAMGTDLGRKVFAALAVVADAVTVANGLPPLLTAAGAPLVEWAGTFIN